MATIYNQSVIAAARETERKKNTRAIIIVLVILIVLVVIGVIIYLLVRKRNSTTSSSTTTNTTGNTTTAGCTSNAQCTVGKPACKVSTGTCVECVDDLTCTGTTTKCKTTTNTCVQCVVDADCGSCQSCNSTTNTCQSVLTTPTVTAAYYTAFDSLHVEWTAVTGATSYVIKFDDLNNPYVPCVNDMCEITVAGNVTSKDIPPGNAACAPGPSNSFVTVTAVTPCGNSVSPGFQLAGQGC